MQKCNQLYNICNSLNKCYINDKIIHIHDGFIIIERNL